MAERYWRLIKLQDGKQWLTDGDFGISPDLVPEILTALENCVYYKNASFNNPQTLDKALEVIRKVKT